MGKSILVAGDFAPVEVLEPNKIRGYKFSNDVLELFKSTDLSIVNLECPLTSADDSHKIIKDGPNMKCEKSNISLLNELNIGLVTLANNHIWDYGDFGLKDTFGTCKENSIDTVGAGLTLDDAQKTYYKQLDDKKIAIVNFAENEWASVNKDHGGAHSFDLIDNLKTIENAKSNSDFLIVIIHGGHEHFSYPSTRMIKQYRFFVERGADAVINHHQHCVNGYEEYLGKPIFYGLGNFVFPSSTISDKWFYGLFIKLNISSKITFELIPFQQIKEPNGDYKIILLQKSKKQKYLEKLTKLNSAIHSEEILSQKWKEFININDDRILYFGFPLGRLGKLLYKLNIFKKLVPRKFWIYLTNQIRCEAHNDVINQLLRDQISKK